MTTTRTNSGRKSAILVGCLYIIGTVAGILSLAFTDPIREAPALLSQVSAHENQVIMGALAVLIMGLALAFVPVIMFPILRKQNEPLALGYVVFRGGLEGILYIATTVSWLLLLPLSRAQVQAGSPDASIMQSLGNILFEGEEMGAISTIVFCVGAWIFYTLLYRSKLVPRWLAVWGLVALVPFAASALLAIFAVIGTLSSTQVVMQLPLALQEMVLAIWLIVKGFNSSAMASLTSDGR